MNILPSAEQIEGSRQFSLRKPCNECPFSRACPPGMTGGSDPRVYVGQAEGPFLLSCHKDKEYEQSTALQNAHVLAQCAGAAIYRANIGTDSRMPSALLHLPADPGRVFSSPAELIAHHNGITVEEAEEILEQTPPYALLMIEIGKLREKNYFAVAK